MRTLKGEAKSSSFLGLIAGVIGYALNWVVMAILGVLPPPIITGFWLNIALGIGFGILYAAFSCAIHYNSPSRIPQILFSIAITIWGALLVSSVIFIGGLISFGGILLGGNPIVEAYD